MHPKNLKLIVTKLLVLCSILLLISCDSMVPTPATGKQKKQTMDKAAFDQSIVSGINKYDNLKNFLLYYGDTIIAYRDSRNYVIEVDRGGKTDTVLHKQDCYTYFQSNSNYDITNVPDFLKTKLDSICKAIGNNIKSFGVCKDKKIRMEIRSEGGENGLYISHNLLWNTNMERDYEYSLNKDTLITGNCIYRIGMTEYHGH